MKPFQAPLSVAAAALFALGCDPSPSGHVHSDTLAYIEAVSEQGMSVARTMAGASNLEDIRGVLLTAKSVEASRYGDISGSATEKVQATRKTSPMTPMRCTVFSSKQ